MWNLAGLFLVYQIGKRWRKYDGECFLFYLCWYWSGPRPGSRGLRTEQPVFLWAGAVRNAHPGVPRWWRWCFLAAGALLLYQRSRLRPAQLYVNQLRRQKDDQKQRRRRVTMAATIMDGKALAAKVKEEVRQQTAQMGRKPGLAVVLVGDDPASGSMSMEKTGLR